MSNLHLVVHVAKKLGSLKERLVFVGGSIMELILDEDYPLEPRVTYDVDTIVEVSGHGPFAKIEENLRQLGFKNDIVGNVVCRWSIDGVTMDVMPTDPKILGFSNPWYKAAIERAEEYELEPGLTILLITAPYHLATKIEAFEGRGKQDFLGSHDLEDIVTLLDGRKTILDEISNSENDLKIFIAKMFNAYLKNPHFLEAIPGHLSPYRSVVGARIDRIEKIIRSIAKLSEQRGLL